MGLKLKIAFNCKKVWCYLEDIYHNIIWFRIKHVKYTLQQKKTNH